MKDIDKINAKLYSDPCSRGGRNNMKQPIKIFEF